MMHQAQWQGMTVGEFFRGYNWRGTAPVLESSVTESSLESLPSLLCLSVADFLAQHNWHGQRSQTSPELPVLQRPTPPPRPLSLTASVADFCRGINWQGTGQLRPVRVAPVPEPEKQPIAKGDSALGLEDLSELF